MWFEGTAVIPQPKITAPGSFAWQGGLGAGPDVNPIAPRVGGGLLLLCTFGWYEEAARVSKLGMAETPEDYTTHYPSDCSDEEWEFCATYLTLMNPDAPQRKHNL